MPRFTQFTNSATQRQFVCFDGGTIAAYDITQTSDEIKDGAILIVPSESVVGVMVKAWPTAITEDTGEFHSFDFDTRDDEYAENIEQAVQLACILGFTISDEVPV